MGRGNADADDSELTATSRFDDVEDNLATPR